MKLFYNEDINKLVEEINNFLSQDRFLEVKGDTTYEVSRYFTSVETALDGVYVVKYTDMKKMVN